MDLYSILLACALVLTAVAVVWSLVSGRSTAAWRLTLAGMAVAIAALLVHLRWGHTPGTSDGMGPVAFVGEHPMLFATLVTSLLLAFRRPLKESS
jgi:thiamine transporter ThiT